MKKILSLLTLLVLMACEENKEVVIAKDAPTTNDGLIGKWKLVESLSDPGDGSGTFQPVTERERQVLEFKANGTLLINSSPMRYELLPNQYVKITSTDGKNEFRWRYDNLTPSSLTFNYQCIEPCAGKYIAVQ